MNVNTRINGIFTRVNIIVNGKGVASILLDAFVLVCITWTRKTNTAAKNGVFYGWSSVSDCQAACVASPSCVAIDTGPVGCVLHHNVSDLVTAYYAPEVTHFVLSRSCQPTSSLRTESPLTSTSSVGITTGSSAEVILFIVNCLNYGEICGILNYGCSLSWNVYPGLAEESFHTYVNL